LVRVLVAMSGGVDSSVAAALLRDQGHEVLGATLKLWGGPSDSGCCSVEDVEDARRVAQQLGIPHHVFDMTEVFEKSVVGPYVEEHRLGRAPNPCVECNRHIKFRQLLDRALRLGFDALGTGHHARVVVRRTPESPGAPVQYKLMRGQDPAKDQSYVLSMLGQAELARVLLPVGELTKADVREVASSLGLRTAAKPDSQDVCFISSDAGRTGFLEGRIPLHPGRVIDIESGDEVGAVDAVELVTVGQRRGMGHGSDGQRRYVKHVDPMSRLVLVGGAEEVASSQVELLATSIEWVDAALSPGSRAVAQVSAHGRPLPCTFEVDASGPVVIFESPQRPVAPGQTVALYDLDEPDAVVGSGIVA